MKKKLVCLILACVLLCASWTVPTSAAMKFIDILCVGESLTCGSGANEAGTISTIVKELTYPARLDAKLPDAISDGNDVVYHSVYNYGISGIAVLPEYKWSWANKGYLVAAKTNTANPFSSSAPAAKYIVVMLGTNDAKDRIWKAEQGTGGAENFYNYYTEMIEAFLDLPSSPKVVCVIPPPVVNAEGINDYEIVEETLRDEITPIIKRVAVEQKCMCVNLREVFPDPVTEREELLKLYAVDDGVHPNKYGYDLIAEAIVPYIMRVSGDANDSGNMTADDLTVLAKKIAGHDVANFSAVNSDVDLDGEVGVGDLMLVAKYLADWDVTLY